jgi:superfamily II DNA helicase RecQ
VCNETFWKNLVIYGIDEVHVLIPWSLEFRTAYHQVALLPKRLSDHVVLVVAMATLATGHDSDALFLALDLRTGKYHCQRLSTERPNIQTVITELGHGLNGYKFQDVMWVFSTPGIKSVLYCRTLKLSFCVAVYGWSLVQEGENPLDCVRLWNSLMSPSYNAKTLHLFETNPHTRVIVTTIAFGMGMNLKNITHSINLGIPDTCDALVQQNG